MCQCIHFSVWCMASLERGLLWDALGPGRMTEEDQSQFWLPWLLGCSHAGSHKPLPRPDRFPLMMTEEIGATMLKIETRRSQIFPLRHPLELQILMQALLWQPLHKWSCLCYRHLTNHISMASYELFVHRLSVELQSNHLTEGVVPDLRDSGNHLTEGVVPILQDSSNHLTEGVVPVLQDSSNHLLTSKSTAQQQSSHRGRCSCYRIPVIQDNNHNLIEGCLCYIIPILQDNNNHLIKRVVPVLQDNSSPLTKGLFVRQYHFFKTASTQFFRKTTTIL